MKQLLLSLFSDSSGLSMMRLLSLICVLTACIIAIYGIIKGHDLNAVAMLCGAFLAAGISGKVVQKFGEKK